jgi:YidC/Oxa1 family membrane protein insertase
MLDFIYFPVSALLWAWHQIFALVLGSADGIAWTLSVVFLVLTLRAALFLPFLRQARRQRVVQRLQPQIKTLQRHHAGDRIALAKATQDLHKANGISPLGGCLPGIAQALMFLGLYHVLRSFNRTGAPLRLSIADNATTPNYVFGLPDVQNFLGAKLAGSPLSAAIRSTTSQLAAYSDHVTRFDVVLVALPLMLIAALATYFTARAAVKRQSTLGPINPQASIMNKLTIWVLPLGVLLGGAFLPVAILIYWLTNNACTLALQHFVNRRLDHEQSG